MQFNGKTADTAKSPGFTSGFDNGHIGLSWGGSIQCFVFNVTFSGTHPPSLASGSALALDATIGVTDNYGTSGYQDKHSRREGAVLYGWESNSGPHGNR